MGGDAGYTAAPSVNGRDSRCRGVGWWSVHVLLRLGLHRQCGSITAAWALLRQRQHLEAIRNTGHCPGHVPHGPGRTASPSLHRARARCRYGARFPTREGYLTVRLPYAAFRSEYQGQPPLDAAKLRNITIRYENKKQVRAVPPSDCAGNTRAGVDLAANVDVDVVLSA